MKRDELLKELDRIIDVGIVNAKHVEGVLLCTEEVIPAWERLAF